MFFFLVIVQLNALRKSVFVLFYFIQTDGGFREPFEYEIRKSPHGSFTKVLYIAFFFLLFQLSSLKSVMLSYRYHYFEGSYSFWFHSFFPVVNCIKENCLHTVALMLMFTKVKFFFRNVKIFKASGNLIRSAT